MVSRRNMWALAAIMAALFGFAIFWLVDLKLGSRAEPAYVERLKQAQHIRSTYPAERHTFDVAKRGGLKLGVQNAMGRELREVSALAKGKPEFVFATLSHLGGYGEIIWVDNWTNFSVKLTPAETGRGGIEVPRNEAVEAALKAIDDAGGTLVRAGISRHLVAKKQEREKFEAAIHKLGWLRGKPAPWEGN